MRGIGTVINVCLIIVGGLIGQLFGNKINKKMQETLLLITGVSVMFLGMGGTIENMFTINNGILTMNQPLMMIISLAVGAIIGEWLDIDNKIYKFGELLKIKTRNNQDTKFVNGFVYASCTVCIGAMAIIGAMNDGIKADYSVLIAKGILDMIIVGIMTISLGKGCIFSAIPVALFQLSITYLSMFIGKFLSIEALNNLSYVGSILIFCVGLNLIRKEKIRIANILPSLIIAILFSYVF